MSSLRMLLTSAAKRKTLPTVIAYNRIDGPGSSLDLREFQQALWTLPQIPGDLYADPTMHWTCTLPRTVGITIDTGTKIHAEPFDPGLIAVQSIEYGTEVTATLGGVLPIKDNWLLKIVDLFGLSGVKFVLHNLRPGIQSSGLGGSASATTGVCILANELAGRPFSPVQLVSMASLIEQDFGVSLTGTQEQSNVLFGGVRDYVWFPWGLPKKGDTGYGTSVHVELLSAKGYEDLQKRIAIFHSGRTRASKDVNAAWIEALSQIEGYRLHQKKLAIAYRFRESLRLSRWDDLSECVQDYQDVRTSLCSAYIDGAKEIQGFAHEKDCVVFPLGAGGGGGILVFGRDPDAVLALRQELAQVYREIPFTIQRRGHEILNLPFPE